MRHHRLSHRLRPSRKSARRFTSRSPSAHYSTMRPTDLSCLCIRCVADSAMTRAAPRDSSGGPRSASWPLSLFTREPTEPSAAPAGCSTATFGWCSAGDSQPARRRESRTDLASRAHLRARQLTVRCAIRQRLSVARFAGLKRMKTRHPPRRGEHAVASGPASET